MIYLETAPYLVAKQLYNKCILTTIYENEQNRNKTKVYQRKQERYEINRMHGLIANSFGKMKISDTGITNHLYRYLNL